MPGTARRIEPGRSASPNVASVAVGGAAPGQTFAGSSGWGLAAWPVAGRDDRHSRRVALLKRLLPAIGVVLLLLIVAWPRLAPLWERIRFAFPAIDLRDARELQMLNPRYAGVDREGRPFVVTAASGRQIPDRQDLMSLQGPRADVKTQGGADITLTSLTGVYQAQSQLLDLFGDVTVVHQNGTRFQTQSARINAATNTAQGDDAVEGSGPSGNVKGQGFRIFDRGETVLFTGRSEMLVRSAKPVPARAAPAGLPTPVAAAAKQAEAEGRPLLRDAASASSTVRGGMKPVAAGKSKKQLGAKPAGAAEPTPSKRAAARRAQ